MKKNDILLIASVALYSFLFYNQTAGINFLIFSVCLTVFLLVKDKFLLLNKAWLFAALCTIVSSIAILLYGNFLSVFTNILSLSLMASLSINKNSSLILALLYSTYSYLSSVAFMAIDFFDKKIKEGTAKNPGGTKFVLILIPIIITTIFFFLYREANPIFKNFTKNISLDFITWAWVRFTLSGFILLYGFFNHRNIIYLFHKDLEASDKLNKAELPEQSTLLGKEITKENENFSGIILFALLNLLILVVNALDFNFLWGSGTLPEGLTYSEFVHQGVGLLIVSILVAIAIILFYFRGGLNFYEKNTPLKLLAYLWILQNALLIIMCASKNELYVNEYSLTYKRIGVFVYLLLSFIGLATTFIKILQTKSNWFLFRKNAWAFYTVLLVSCFINWDSFITSYNIEHSKELDKKYLLNLSSSTLPDLINISDRKDTTSQYEQDTYKNRLHTKTFNFLTFKKSTEWQSWNVEDNHVSERISKLEKAGRLARLKLNSNGIGSLSVIANFNNVQELELQNNRLEKLEELSSFQKLEKLNLSGNALDSLDKFPSLKKLTYLDLSNNQISDITFLANSPAIETFIFRNNNYNYLQNYPDLPNLKVLDLSNTPAGNYDIAKYKNLRELRLNQVGKQNLTSLPELPNLETLELRNKYISNSDKAIFETIAKYKTLKKLDLGSNAITDLNVIAFEGNTIEELSVAHNDLKNSWGTEKFTSLKKLDVSYCNLTDFSPGSDLVNLSELNLSNNKISNLTPLSALTNLKRLDLTFNAVNDLQSLKSLVHLEDLNLHGNTITDLKVLTSLSKLERLNLENNPISDYSSLTKMKGLRTLQLGYITDDLIKTISQIKNLEHLFCENISTDQKKTLLKALPHLKIKTKHETNENIYVVTSETTTY